MTDTKPRRLDAGDYGCLALILAALAGYVLATFNFGHTPTEDAAILLRYADHLARGLGIVWNPGEAPVDGATDFFLMVTLAGLARTGMGVETATLVLGFASHLVTLLLVFLGARRLHGAPRWMASLAAAFLALGPGLRYVEVYFGTPYFALFATICWYALTHAYLYGERRSTALVFAASALLLGMTRPEGVFLSAFMGLGLLATRGWSRSRRTALTYAVVMAVGGTAYFLWRWNHFGYPLPNTYYVRGRGGIYWKNLIDRSRDVVQLAPPFVGVIGFAVVAELVVRRRPTRAQVFLLVPVVLFTALGVLHLGLMDYLHRFQYCLLPLLLVSWPGILCEHLALWSNGGSAVLTPPRRQLLTTLAVLFAAGALAYQVKTFPTSERLYWGTENVARILADYSTDHTVAVTNAGHLPYVSGWCALDAWGLNQQEIAHEGPSRETIARYHPEVIQFDHRYVPMTGDPPDWHPWWRHTRALWDYALENDYELAAVFGASPYKVHYYYVRRDFPESEEIVRRIREVDYYIGGRPERCFDFSAAERERAGG